MILPTHIVATGGLIINEKNEILLVKNPRKGWEYPGGIVEEGETLIIVNPKLQFRFRKALGYESAFYCVGTV